MNFGPKNAEEARVFAESNLRVDVQHRIQSVMNYMGVSQHDLAERLGTSEAFISQLFSSRMNSTIHTVARVFHALGDECYLSSQILDQLGKTHYAMRRGCAWATVESTSPGHGWILNEDGCEGSMQPEEPRAA